MGRPAAGEERRLEIVGLYKAFGIVPVLQGIDLTVGTGEFVSLLGPSGCGKTTTLNIVAGFIGPDAGDVRISGRSMAGVPPHRRDLGMVFQSHALFPHMTVADNVAFGLRMRGARRADLERRVGEALEMVRLAGFETRYPRELSGGQQQRVGLARALTVRPRLLLLDEPLSSLDAKLRREMQVELRSIQRFVNITALYVTHDQEEALTLSDRIVLMNHGRVEQVGTPEEVYTRPASEFVAGFIGEASLLDARVIDVAGLEATVEFAGGGRARVAAGRPLGLGETVRLAVRPDRVTLAPLGEHEAPAGHLLVGTLISRAFLGPVLRCMVDLASERRVQAEVASATGLGVGVGQRVVVSVAPADWVLVRAGKSVS